MGNQENFKEVTGISGLEAEDILLGKIRRVTTIESGAPTRASNGNLTMGLIFTPQRGDYLDSRYIEIAAIVYPDRVTGRVWTGNVTIARVEGISLREVMGLLGDKLAEWLES